MIKWLKSKFVSSVPDPAADLTGIFILLTSTREIDYVCGHRGSCGYLILAYGRRIKKIRSRCPICALAEATRNTKRCVICGLAIIKGDTVNLHSPQMPNLRRDIGHMVDGGYLGCSACPGGHFAGSWTGTQILRFRKELLEKI